MNNKEKIMVINYHQGILDDLLARYQTLTDTLSTGSSQGELMERRLTTQVQLKIIELHGTLAAMKEHLQ